MKTCLKPKSHKGIGISDGRNTWPVGNMSTVSSNVKPTRNINRLKASWETKKSSEATKRNNDGTATPALDLDKFHCN